jgi:hypothetical protein
MVIKMMDPDLRADVGNNILILMVAALTLSCNFWPIFQFSTYNRQYFEGFTSFNIIGLIFTLLLSFVVILSGKKFLKYYSVLFVISLVGLILTQILGMLYFPVMASPTKQASMMILGFLPSTLGYPVFLGLLFFSLSNFGCLIRWISVSKRGISARFLTLLPILSLGIYLLVKIGFNSSLKDLFYTGAITGSAALSTILAIPRNFFQSTLANSPKPSDGVSSTKIRSYKESLPKLIYSIALPLLSWAIHTFLFYCLEFFYFQLHSYPQFATRLQNFYISLVFGAGAVALCGFSKFFLQIGKSVLLFVGISCTLLFFSSAMIRFEITGPSFIMGFAFVSLIVDFIQQCSRRCPSQYVGPILLLSLLVSNYTVTIPSHDWEIYQAGDVAEILLWILMIVIGGLSVINILRSGNWSKNKINGGKEVEK